MSLYKIITEDELAHSKSHKYIEKISTGKGYRYVYDEDEKTNSTNSTNFPKLFSKDGKIKKIETHNCKSESSQNTNNTTKKPSLISKSTKSDRETIKEGRGSDEYKPNLFGRLKDDYMNFGENTVNKINELKDNASSELEKKKTGIELRKSLSTAAEGVKSSANTKLGLAKMIFNNDIVNAIKNEKGKTNSKISRINELAKMLDIVPKDNANEKDKKAYREWVRKVNSLDDKVFENFYNMMMNKEKSK